MKIAAKRFDDDHGNMAVHADLVCGHTETVDSEMGGYDEGGAPSWSMLMGHLDGIASRHECIGFDERKRHDAEIRSRLDPFGQRDCSCGADRDIYSDANDHALDCTRYPNRIASEYGDLIQTEPAYDEPHSRGVNGD